LNNARRNGKKEIGDSSWLVRQWNHPLRKILSDPLDLQRSTGSRVHLDHCPVKHNTIPGDLKPLRHTSEESLYDRLDLAAQHAFVWTGESSIAQISGAAGKNLFIGRLHVRVRSDDGADLAVKQTGKGNFLGRRFSVKIHEDDVGLLTQFFDDWWDEKKRVL
jgi:hypothetical protein